jgi:uncharacterized membrane protein YqgA involved in biofilm formation
MLIVLGALLLGGIAGSLLGIEQRMEAFGGRRQVTLARSGRWARAGRRLAALHRGFVSSSLVFRAGPLTVLGSLSDGFGAGPDQLFLKSALNGFAAVAIAASLGWGVAASAIAVLLVQGSLTALGAVLNGVLPEAHLAR